MTMIINERQANKYLFERVEEIDESKFNKCVEIHTKDGHELDITFAHYEREGRYYFIFTRQLYFYLKRNNVLFIKNHIDCMECDC